MGPDDDSAPQRSDAEARRDQALARYDAHPGIAIALLAAMGIFVWVVAYDLFTSERTDLGPPANNPMAPAPR